MPKDVILQADLGGTPLTSDELAAIPDFKGIRKEIWDKFPGAIAKKTYLPGEILMREGENGTTAFYILSGEVDIFIANPVASARSSRGGSKSLLRGFTKITGFLKGVPAKEGKDRPARTHIPLDAGVDVPIDNPAATLGAGEMIGELAALAALKQDRLKRPKFYPRSATVRAKTTVEALEMLPNILNNVLYNSAAFKEKLNKNYRTRALDNHFRSIPVFQNVGQKFLDELRDRVELVDVQPGQVICRQGEVADAFYLIRLGFVKVTQDFPGGEMVLTYLSRGSYFGEMGLLPPVYRVRVKGGEFVEHFDLTPEDGQVRVSDATESFLLNPGESFIVGDTTFEVVVDPFLCGLRTATCTAMDYVQLVRIKGEDFAGMLAQFPEIEAAITKVALERREMDMGLRNRIQTVSLNDFLKQELMQGQNLLLIDLTKCTRCDECVKACVATHDDGVTRLIRDGLRFDKYLAPTSCRACMDPLCMTRCPVGSIRRKESLDIVIEDWCIGCGNCAIDCPYGNINVVEIAAATGRGQKAEPRPKAVVCDLCVEYSEPNCVRACPHDAALRVEPKKFFAEELKGFTQ